MIYRILENLIVRVELYRQSTYNQIIYQTYTRNLRTPSLLKHQIHNFLPPPFPTRKAFSLLSLLPIPSHPSCLPDLFLPAGRDGGEEVHVRRAVEMNINLSTFARVSLILPTIISCCLCLASLSAALICSARPGLLHPSQQLQASWSTC